MRLWFFPSSPPFPAHGAPSLRSSSCPRPPPFSRRRGGALARPGTEAGPPVRVGNQGPGAGPRVPAPSHTWLSVCGCEASSEVTNRLSFRPRGNPHRCHVLLTSLQTCRKCFSQSPRGLSSHLDAHRGGKSSVGSARWVGRAGRSAGGPSTSIWWQRASQFQAQDDAGLVTNLIAKVCEL